MIIKLGGITMNETTKVLCERRSVKKYNTKKVSDELIKEIVKCGTYAPNGMGKQSPVIVVIRDEKTIAKLRKLNASVANMPHDPFYNANTILVVLADKRVPTYLYDGSLVMGNLMNAAYSLGVDSCWIHRAKETFQTKEGQELLKKWGLDENYEGIGNCLLGYRDYELPIAKPRKDNYVIYD